MENIQHKLTTLNDYLKSLNLEPGRDLGNISSEVILVGKVLATRTYRRFAIVKIVKKIWTLQNPIKVEKLEDNIFKF